MAPDPERVAWLEGYEAGYKQACKDVKTEQQELPLDHEPRHGFEL